MITKKRIVLISILVLLATISIYSYIIYLPNGQEKNVLIGSFFTSDAGESHGGFEYTAEWNATLTIYGTSGKLSLILNQGLGDALGKHEFQITDFSFNQSALVMKIDGKPAFLKWINNDTVWDHVFDNYYIASWGAYAQQTELRGTLTPSMFPGLADHYYVEIRLR
jgi:hypothetical protein